MHVEVLNNNFHFSKHHTQYLYNKQITMIIMNIEFAEFVEFVLVSICFANNNTVFIIAILFHILTFIKSLTVKKNFSKKTKFLTNYSNLPSRIIDPLAIDALFNNNVTRMITIFK